MTHKEMVRTDLIIPKLRNGKPITWARNPMGTRYTVKPEVREWLHQNTTGHWYFFTDSKTSQLSIAFHKKQDAVFWKLTWH